MVAGHPSALQKHLAISGVQVSLHKPLLHNDQRQYVHIPFAVKHARAFQSQCVGLAWIRGGNLVFTSKQARVMKPAATRAYCEACEYMPSLFQRTMHCSAALVEKKARTE